MDLKSIAEAYQSIQEGKVNAGLQAYLDKKKGCLLYTSPSPRDA